MTDDWTEIIQLGPRIIKFFKDHPNYIVQNKKFLYKDRMIEFSIEDDRESHGTITKIIGLDEDISALGYGILFNANKILLEQWNDSELNCWLEYNIEKKEEIYIRLKELEPYLLYYIPEKQIRDKYFEEIQKFYSTEAFKYVHYYFTLDQNSDQKMLENEIENLVDPQEQWSKVKEIAQEYIDQNTRDSTWRAICIMIKSNEIFFKGTAIEPIVLSETHLIGETALSWGGKTQLQWISIARKYWPIYKTLYEIIDEKDRKRETWIIITYEILPHLIFGHDSKFQKNSDIEKFQQIINIAKRGDDTDKLIVNTALKWLLKKRKVNLQQRIFLKKQPLLK